MYFEHSMFKFTEAGREQKWDLVFLVKVLELQPGEQDADMIQKSRVSS